MPTVREEEGEWDSSLYFDASSGREGYIAVGVTVRVVAVDTTESCATREYL
jgi:hypothetical protein